MNPKFAVGMNMCKGNENTTTLLFSRKGHGIVHKERRGKVNPILIEHFRSILFHESGPANNQHTYQSINQSNERTSLQLVQVKSGQEGRNTGKSSLQRTREKNLMQSVPDMEISVHVQKTSN
jgi:hypothetical protein